MDGGKQGGREVGWREAGEEGGRYEVQVCRGDGPVLADGVEGLPCCCGHCGWIVVEI